MPSSQQRRVDSGTHKYRFASHGKNARAIFCAKLVKCVSVKLYYVYVECTNAHHINLTNERFQYYFFITFNQTTLMEWLMSCNQSQIVDCENYKLRKPQNVFPLQFYKSSTIAVLCILHPMKYCIVFIRFDFLCLVQPIHIKFPK